MADRAQPRKGTAARWFLGTLAILLVFCFAIPLVIIGVTGKAVTEMTVPTYSNTLGKLGRAQLLRAYAAPVDASIAPLRAGEAFTALGVREGDKPVPGRRPITAPPVVFLAIDSTMFRGAGGSGWVGPASQNIIRLAKKGFARAEMDYLAALDAMPVWTEYSTVARSRRMDLAGGMYVTPFPADFSPFEVPIPRFAATKELAYAAVARAAWHVAAGRNAEAEGVLREIVSNGFHLIDDGNSLIDVLIGVVIVGVGRDGFEQFYEVTNNPQLAHLRADIEQYDSALKNVTSPAVALTDFPRMVADSTVLRAMRYEMALGLSVSPCVGVKSVLFGPPAEVAVALESARKQLARTPAEGELFDLNTHALDRAAGFMRRSQGAYGPRALYSLSRIPAFLLHNSRISNCIALFSSGIAN